MAICSLYSTDPSGPAFCETSTVSFWERMRPSLVEIQ